MEAPSAPAHRGLILWKELLLAVSLLILWSLPSTARLTSESTNAAEGEDVLLPVHSQPENLISYSWYKGENVDINRQITTYIIAIARTIPGPAHSGREIIYANGALLFQEVTLQDTGHYTVQAISKDLQNEVATVQLRVYHGPDASSISPSDSHHPPGANLRLSCHAASNPPAQYSWLINGRPQPPTQELFIPSITASDSGSCICLAHNSVTGLNRTTVKTITVTEPVGKPFIQARNTNVTEHRDTVVLTCLTNDTGISIWWFFRDQSLLLTERTKLSQDNSTLIIEPVRREDAGGYQCEVSNPVSASKSDPLRLGVQSENDHTGYPVGTIAGIVIGILVLAALGTTLGYFLYLRRTGRASDSQGLTEHRPPASTPGQGLPGASTSPGRLPGSRTASPIYEDLLHPSTDVYCRISPRADGAS